MRELVRSGGVCFALNVTPELRLLARELLLAAAEALNDAPVHWS